MTRQLTFTRLIFKSYRARGLLNGITVFSLATSFLLILLIAQIRDSASQHFQQTLSGIDLIVGPRTGSTELLLSSVFHIGEARYGMPLSSWQQLQQSPKVEYAIPIALGDSFRGFPVVASDDSLFQHFRYGQQQPLRWQAGQAFQDPTQIVVGANVAKQLGLSLGQTLVLNHGRGNVSFHQHRGQPKTISGILATTGTPFDNSLLLSLPALAQLHDEQTMLPTQISAVLIGLKQRRDALSMQYQINQQTASPLLAILPLITLRELWQLFERGEQSLQAVSGCVLLAGLLGMFGMLMANQQQRLRELALLRAIGARPWQLWWLLNADTLLNLLAAALLSLGLQLMLTPLLAPWLLTQFGWFVTWPSWTWATLQLFAAATIIALFFSLWPSWRVYRQSLLHGLSIKY